MNEVSHEAVIARLIESDQGKKIAADILRDQQMHHIDLATSIEKLKRERGEGKRALADKVAVSHARLQTARAALTTAETEHQKACMEQAQHGAHYTSRINKLERQLRATAPASISDFISWLNDEEDTCKATALLESSERTDKLNTHTSEIIRKYYSNANGLRDRLAAIRNARAEAEKLKDKVLDAADIETRLQALRDTLPAVTMQFSHEK